MTPQTGIDLRVRILDVLRQAGREVSMADIEREVRTADGPGTFAVREAIWGLVRDRQAAFTTDLSVKLTPC